MPPALQPRLSRWSRGSRGSRPSRALLPALALLLLLSPLPSPAGWVVPPSPDSPEAQIHLTLFDLPDPSRTDPATRAELAVQREFLRLAPSLLRERALLRDPDADPPPYVLHLHRFSGIQVEGVESTLLAIAGNVAPDVLSVNFRQSDTYIRQGFLYPLDLPADRYFPSLPPSDVARRIHPKIAPVVRRPSPSGPEHVWMLPAGPPLGRVILFRRDLFDAARLPYPAPDWTWDDFLAACRAIADPASGTYAIGLSRGKHESYLWLPFLWGAGGEALAWDETSRRWIAAFDSPEAARALDFYLRITSEPWRDSLGRLRRGYAIKDPSEANLKWQRGQLGMRFSYLDDQLFASLNPDLTGMAPMPVGPASRGTEINSRMLAIFAGVTNPLVRDAAWEFIRFQYSPEADAIRVSALVQGGFGRFVSPERLAAAGFPDLSLSIPPEWRDCQDIAIRDGRPEPYGQNANTIYDILTPPIRRAEELSLNGSLPTDPEARLAVLRSLLADAKRRADVEMLGRVPPSAMRIRRAAAVALLLLLLLLATLAVRQTLCIFFPKKASAPATRSPDGRLSAGQPSPSARPRPFRRYLPPLLLILPAALTILLWAYVPLVRGSLMAFFDYHIFGTSAFVGLDNFANLLWDPDWWLALLASARYALLVIVLTFIPPVLLAVLLQETPVGSVFFRVVFYLPAAISGLVVILMWKSFLEPSEAGLLNRLVLPLPGAAWLLLALLPLLLGLHLARRLAPHNRLHAFLALAAALLLASAALSPFRRVLDAAPSFLAALSSPLPEPVRWLDDSRTALFSCVLPMLWAGMGPGCLIYLAALKGIPDDLYEAADIDGASFTDKLLFVVLPVLRPLLVINFVGVFIAAWQAEANILAMTAGGAGTEVAGLRIFYQAFVFLRLGPATAAAWMLASILIGFTLLQLRILSRVQFRANRPEE